jgi:5-methylcytosine-specific restriction endonuclease McrA
MVTKRVMRANTKAARLLGQQLGPPPPPSDLPEACPLCGRPLIPGPSVDEHHLVPRSQGGKEKFLVHKICHQKIHQVFTEKELARRYSRWELLQSHDEMAVFIEWVRKRPPEFLR